MLPISTEDCFAPDGLGTQHTSSFSNHASYQLTLASEPLLGSVRQKAAIFSPDANCNGDHRIRRRHHLANYSISSSCVPTHPHMHTHTHTCTYNTYMHIQHIHAHTTHTDGRYFSFCSLVPNRVMPLNPIDYHIARRDK